MIQHVDENEHLCALNSKLSLCTDRKGVLTELGVRLAKRFLADS